MKSSALVRKTTPAGATGGPDAFGYAPVKLAVFEDGARIALPSTKPDWEKLQAAAAPGQPAQVGPLAPAASNALRTAAAIPASTEAAAGTAPAPGARPEDGIAALKADVDERRASLVVMTEGKGDRVAPAQQGAQAAPATELAAAVPAAAAAPTAPPAAEPASRIASAKDLIDPRKSVPAAISAVAQSADAVKVAAIDTTTRAIDGTSRVIDAVQTRLGDTFKGTDTVTGSAAIDQMIEDAAAENNIPTELAYAVVRVESHYNPTAIGGGAYGLSQIKPATARGLGFDGPAKGLFDPRTNLRYGMKYLAGAWELSGHDVCGAAMRYKGGHRTTTMSRAASIYCSNVKRHMAAIERRRGPANRETVIAASERTKQIAAAGGPFDMGVRAAMPATSVARNTQTAEAVAKPAPAATTAFGTVAASSAGRAIAAAAPAGRGAAVAGHAGVDGIKSGRVRVYSDGEAAPPAAPIAIAADGRFGYAD